jgi:hypothetical protein
MRPNPWGLHTILGVMAFLVAYGGLLALFGVFREPEPSTKPCAGIERPTSSGGIRCDLGKT